MRAPTGTLLRVCLVVSMAMGLVACSDPDQPSTLPSDSPKPSSSAPSPTPATPEEQVEAAVRAYYAELTRAAQTQDTANFKRLMSEGCPCYSVAKAIDKTRRSGKTTPDAAWTPSSVKVHDVERELAAAEVEYVVDAYRVLDSDGDVVDRYPRQTGHVDLSLVRVGERWIVGNLFDMKG